MGLIGITAAIMSSADSSMLSASSMVTKNVYQSFLRPMASDVEVSLVLRIMVFAIGSWATYLALSVESVFNLWLFCSDIVYVLLFPQLICVLYFKESNTYGSLLAFLISALFRWLCGEPSMNVPVTIRLPLYDEEHGQQFPFRLACMLIGLLTQLMGSYCAARAFQSGWLPQRLDVFQCFASVKSKPGDQSGTTGGATGTLQPQGSDLSVKNDVSGNDAALKNRKTSASETSYKARRTSTVDSTWKGKRINAAEAKRSRRTGDGGSSKSKQQSSSSHKDVEADGSAHQAPEPSSGKSSSSSSAKSDVPADSKTVESKREGGRPSDPSRKERRSKIHVHIDVAAIGGSKSEGEQPKEG
ncbi:hypothetical protein HPB50_014016 [Hyalomma asiaticum]|uniref:Uncharacterized protein n=1 Tax=Hyalomma asiaticum TaxID=266040 RepID=A0ACB7SHT7_HYAAI|nr:hypothetical protein HPB50_014016 [Hyalomma asiaticum]